MEAQPQAKENNGFCMAGFILGCVSVLLFYFGILPLAGVIVSIVGMSTFKKSQHKNFWMGPTGLALSGLYCLAYFYHSGYFE